MPQWHEPNPEVRKRMLREARSCEGMRHPGIVPILSYASEGDWFWWVRPWLAGGRLSSELGQPLSRALLWLRQLVAALACARRPGLPLYERGVAVWETGAERGKIDRFALAFLALHDGEEAPSKLAQQCFQRAADWARALVVSERALAREHARLHWLLPAWLEWGLVAPDVRELGSLLYRFPEQRLDARFDPLFMERLPEDAPAVWLQCLPKHWTQSRLRLRRRGGGLSGE